MFVVSFICKVVWRTKEFCGISLGRFAPYVFGGMIGRWPRRIR